MANRIYAVQVCDATDDDSSTEAGKKIFLYLYLFQLYFLI